MWVAFPRRRSSVSPDGRGADQDIESCKGAKATLCGEALGAFGHPDQHLPGDAAVSEFLGAQGDREAVAAGVVTSGQVCVEGDQAPFESGNLLGQVPHLNADAVPGFQVLGSQGGSSASTLAFSMTSGFPDAMAFTSA